MVDRFVAGETLDDALAAVRALAADGIAVTLDHLGEDVTDPRRGRALAATPTWRRSTGWPPSGSGGAAEVSVKLSAFGQALPGGHDVALELVRPVVEAATAMGTTVTLDMEDYRTVDSTLAALAELRREHPGTGAVLQAMLFRTEDDAEALAVPGSRVRLVKGAYDEPATVAHQKKKDVDAAYARCLEMLMAGPGYPMVGSHDPAMVARAHELAAQHSRAADSWEVQMLYGIRPDEQRRLAAAGTRVRAYVPYGVDWYGYFMRRLAERPANVGFFLRSLLTQVLKRSRHGRRHPCPRPAQRAGPRLRARVRPSAPRSQARLAELAGRPIELTITVGGRQRMAGGEKFDVVQPHRHAAVLGTSAHATHADAEEAVRCAKEAAPAWQELSFDDRAAVFLKAADLLAGPWRQTLNAATMLGQSKTAYQAEIDAACELIDFWR